MRVVLLVAVGALPGLFIAAAANADHILGLDGLTYISKDTVVDRITDLSYVVGYGNKTDYHDRINGVGVTLTLTENARVHSAVAASGSIINSAGVFPSTTGGLGAVENGVANMNGGLAYFTSASDNGTINMSGGRTNFAWFQGSSTGNFGNAVIGNPSFPVSGTSLEAQENSTVMLNGTQIVEEMRATNNGRIIAVGATVGRDVTARGTSRIEMLGGTLGRDVITFDQAAVSGNGVFIARDVAANAGSITLANASVGRSVRSTIASSLTLNNVTIADELFAEGPVFVTGGVVNGNVTKAGVGTLTLIDGQVVGDVTAIDTAFVALSGATVGGNVSVRNGSITDTQIGGHVTNAGTGTVTRLDVSGGKIERDLLISGRGGVYLSGDVGGDAIIGALGFLDMSGGTVSGDVTSGNFGIIRGGEVAGHLNIDAGSFPLLGGRVGRDVKVASSSEFSLLSTGAVGGNVVLAANGLFTMSGGTVERDVNLSATARALLNRGTVAGNVNAPADAEVTLDGATVSGNLVLGEASEATIEGGAIDGGILASGSQATRVQMSGGTVAGDVSLAGGTLLALSGGEVAGELAASDATSIMMAGGQVAHLRTAGAARAVIDAVNASDITLGDVTAAGGSDVALTLANVNGVLRVEDSATVTTTAVTVRDIRASGRGRITMRSGTSSAGGVLQDDSSMTVYTGDLGGLVIDGRAQLLLDNTVTDSSGGTGIIRTGHVGVSVFGRFVAIGPKDLFITSLGVDHSGVAVLNGGDIELGVSLQTHAALTIGHGAIVRGGVHARHTSTINMDAGTIVGDVQLVDDSTFALSGGIVQGNVLGLQRNFIDLFGGQVDLAGAEQESEIVFGGTATAKKVLASGSARLLMHGGTVATDAVASGRAVMTVSGEAEVGGHLIANDDVRLFMTGGVVRNDLIAKDDATVTVSGGRIVGRAIVSERVTFHWSGGTINGNPPAPAAAPALAALSDPALQLDEPPVVNLLAAGASTLNVYGTDLEAALLDANYQDLYSLYQLTGVFADGTMIDGVHFAISNGTGASYHLLPPSAIPEPAQLSLGLAIAASCGIRRRTHDTTRRRTWPL